MSDFFTTRQLQDLLQVDRTTIYRMADSGRVPAVKVGNQWRFPRSEVNDWLGQTSHRGPGDASSGWENAAPSSAVQDLRKLLPLECVQLIQDTFADLLGVMVVITDLNGEAVTAPSNPCELFTLAEGSPDGRRRCMRLWAELAREPGMQPRFIESDLGLMCARGMVRVGSELQAMVVVGGVAPKEWPPSAQEIERMAGALNIDSDELRNHIEGVYRLSEQEEQSLLDYVQRIADIVSHIVQERNQFFSTLQHIAELTKI